MTPTSTQRKKTTAAIRIGSAVGKERAVFLTGGASFARSRSHRRHFRYHQPALVFRETFLLAFLLPSGTICPVFQQTSPELPGAGKLEWIEGGEVLPAVGARAPRSELKETTMRRLLASINPPESANPKCREAWFALFLCLGGVLALAGCAGEKIAEVSGRATVDGKPLVSSASTIMFAPDKDNRIQRIPSAALDENGMFQVNTGAQDGVPLGWYKVYVAFDARQSKGKPPPFHSRYLDPATSPFSIEVVANPKPGAYDLKLTEK